MKRLLFFIATFLLTTNLFSQATASLFTVCALPSVLNETSGIEKTGANIFWSHNDSGGQPALYKFDSSGTLLKTLTISNATNVDWEDLALDSLNNMYVGDFGNNNNNRSVANSNGLKIYKISNPNSISGTTVNAGIINFEYADRNFSAPANNHNFDMEGFFHFNDSLHLFTKNRTSPTNGWIKHYVLPCIPGTFIASVVDSFNNGGVRICSADISPNKKRVALLANDKIWLFSCFKGSKFISTGTNTVLTLPLTQKESVVFATDSIIYITDEFTNPIGQKLYRSNVSTAFPPPVNITVTSNNSTLCIGQIAILNASGANTYSWSNSAFAASITISPSVTTIYYVTGTAINGCQNTASYTQNVTPCTAVFSSTKTKSQINIYPNPFKNTITVQINEQIPSEIRIYNTLGALIFSENTTQNTIEIDLKNQSAGIYLISLKNSSVNTFKKIIKE